MNRRGFLGFLGLVAAAPREALARPARPRLGWTFERTMSYGPAPRGSGDIMRDLQRALEAGSYVSGAALQLEDLAPVMRNVTFQVPRRR